MNALAQVQAFKLIDRRVCVCAHNAVSAKEWAARSCAPEAAPHANSCIDTHTHARELRVEPAGVWSAAAAAAGRRRRRWEIITRHVRDNNP